MDLTAYSSFFEVFLALNIGYASVERFRTTLTDDILKSDMFDFSRFKNAESTLKSTLNPTKEGQQGILSNLLLVIDDKRIVLKSEEKRKRFFIDMLRPTHLLVGVFCLFVLIVGAIQEDNFEAIILNSKSSQLVIYVAAIISAFCYCLFFCSFLEKALNNKFKIKPMQVTLLFTISLIATTILLQVNTGTIEEVVIFLIIPFGFFIYLYWKAVGKFEEYNSVGRFVTYWKSCIDLVTQNNSKVFWGFSVFFIFIYSLFVQYHFRIFDLPDWFSVVFEHLILIITPFLPYIILAIRVLFHRREFSSKSSKQAAQIEQQYKDLLKAKSKTEKST